MASIAREHAPMNVAARVAAGALIVLGFAMSAVAQGITPPAAPQSGTVAPAGATASPAPAAETDTPDPMAILAQAKAATGGTAWDGMRSQHSRVSIVTGSDKGSAERWASITTGRSRMHVRISGHTDAILGYDGLAAWMADASGKVGIQSDPQVMELIVNAAYRDRLAFWYPERQAARIEYARRDSAGGSTYDVVRITPEGGRAYEMWIGTTTHLVERLREQEQNDMRTETYSDFRSVQGVKVPFTIVATRTDAGPAERYTVESIEYNVPVDGIEFSPPQTGRMY